LATHCDIARELGKLGRSDAKLMAKLERNRARRCDLLTDLMQLDREHLDDDTVIAAAAPKNEPPPPPPDPPPGR
jgi:hypothetical protein